MHLTLPSQIGIGFSEAKVRLDRLPGWETNSWAYHGDDGFSFCQTTSGKSYGPKFGYPDVIGCGINFKTGQIFYTRNGNHLGILHDLKSLYHGANFDCRHSISRCEGRLTISVNWLEETWRAYQSKLRTVALCL